MYMGRRCKATEDGGTDVTLWQEATFSDCCSASCGGINGCITNASRMPISVRISFAAKVKQWHHRKNNYLDSSCESSLNRLDYCYVFSSSQLSWRLVSFISWMSGQSTAVGWGILSWGVSPQTPMAKSRLYVSWGLYSVYLDQMTYGYVWKWGPNPQWNSHLIGIVIINHWV